LPRASVIGRLRYGSICGVHAAHPQRAHAVRLIVLESAMLETIIVILVVLWLLGMVSSFTMGGLIHILLVIAIVVVLLRVIGGRKVL
jgi:hypothetical protein